MTNPIVYPDYIRIIKRKLGGWLILGGKPFYNPSNTPMKFQYLYGISEEKLSVELFRINGGKEGYYLADLRNKKYYYCGRSRESVKPTLLSLGIGRPDPMEK